MHLHTFARESTSHGAAPTVESETPIILQNKAQSHSPCVYENVEHHVDEHSCCHVSTVLPQFGKTMKCALELVPNIGEGMEYKKKKKKGPRKGAKRAKEIDVHIQPVIIGNENHSGVPTLHLARSG